MSWHKSTESFLGWFIFLSAQFQKLLKSPICCGFKHVDGIECYPILNGMGRIKDVKARLNSDISLSFIDKINNQKLLGFFLTALWKTLNFQWVSKSFGPEMVNLLEQRYWPFCAWYSLNFLIVQTSLNFTSSPPFVLHQE